MLDIPALGTVPRTYTLHREACPLLAAAVGAIGDHNLRVPGDERKPHVEIVRDALTRWLRTHAGPLKHIEIYLHVSARSGRHRPAGPGLAVELSGPSDTPRILHIGKRVHALEHSISGLGRSALWWIDHAAAKAGVPVFTPAAALSAASWHYWRGHLDERAALAEIRADGEDPDDIEIMTRAQFDRHIPAWASNPRSVLKPAPLARLATRRPEHFTGRAAAALGELIAAVRRRGVAESRDANDEWLPTMPPALFLRWTGRDAMPRVFDDYAHEIAQCGDYETAWATLEASPTDVSTAPVNFALREWMKRVEPLLGVLRALDALVDQIAEIPDAR